MGYDNWTPDRKDVVQVGDIVFHKPVTFRDKDGDDAGFLSGRVVWVHPQGAGIILWNLAQEI